MNAKILSTSYITHDVKRFVVEKPDGYKFIPGQATLVAINTPKWKYEKRDFSFTSLNEDPQLEFIIKAYPRNIYPNHGGVTEELHKLKEKDEITIERPYGTISYKGLGVFIAGGAGITPFIAILRQLYKDGKLRGNKLIFSNKTSKDVILEKELRKMLADDLILVLTREEKNGYEYGRIDEEFLKKHINNFSQHFYVCGPKEMVKQIRQILKNLGAQTDSLVFEK
ncbi:flavodoxin reductase [Candidatus Woesebacteria bacterium RBG_16_34_12]|uniref:Flavodoxin reductase n=1 Tax=Candidatus Woesebacteria bacterium RBG_16_34_12 TaxID=1802480 RepID=A0A1F7X803_9BACT|nr:MAG: flavodoxin reductase [Candidatus Woesebacteria bacterium RBG_16_34_12]